jgi:hypothetical protein
MERPLNIQPSWMYFMIFDVIDPKEHSLNQWIEKIEGFLEAYDPKYERQEGELYFCQNDIAEPWAEESILYTVPGPKGGKIELRGIDEQVYLFTEEFAGRNLKDTKDTNHFHLVAPSCVYGFTHNALKKSRFHEGPIQGAYFLYQGERAEYPQATSHERLWGGVLLKAIYWIHNQVSRFQDQQKLVDVEHTQYRLEMEVEFNHKSAVNLVIDKVHNRTAIKSRQDKKLVIAWKSPTFEHMRELFEGMPTVAEQYASLKLRVVWEVFFTEGGSKEVTYIGAEKRALKPLIHLPKMRTSKDFRDAFKAHFKGYRVDKQDYLLDLVEFDA